MKRLAGRGAAEIARMKGVEAAAQISIPGGCVGPHFCCSTSWNQVLPPTLAWGALLHDVGKPPTFRRAERIRFDGHVEWA